MRVKRKRAPQRESKMPKWRWERVSQGVVVFMIFKHHMGWPLFCFHLKLSHKQLFGTVILPLLDIKNDEARSEDDRQNMSLKMVTGLWLLTCKGGWSHRKHLSKSTYEDDTGSLDRGDPYWYLSHPVKAGLFSHHNCWHKTEILSLRVGCSLFWA